MLSGSNNHTSPGEDGEKKAFSLALRPKQPDDVVRVFSRKKDERILVKRVVLHRGIGMIILFK